MKSIEDRVKLVFKKVFETEEVLALQKNDSFDWDSLKHIELVLELEDEFEIELTNSAISEICDFKSCVKTLSEFK